MKGYAGEVVVDVKDTPFAGYDRAAWILHFVEQYGYIDGAHNKDWLLDQIAQLALGTEVVVKLATWKDDAGTVVNREYRVTLVDPPSEKYLLWRQAGEALTGAQGEE